MSSACFAFSIGSAEVVSGSKNTIADSCVGKLAGLVGLPPTLEIGQSLQIGRKKCYFVAWYSAVGQFRH
jgi:hypothetical protein